LNTAINLNFKSCGVSATLNNDLDTPISGRLHLTWCHMQYIIATKLVRPSVEYPSWPHYM